MDSSHGTTLKLVPTKHGNYYAQDDPGERGYDGEPAPRRSVTDNEAKILARCARNRLVLEIGTGIGISTRAMARTAKWMTTVDVDPWVCEVVWPELQRQFPGLVCRNTVIGDSEIFGMAFVDGHHGHDAVTADLTTCKRVLRPLAPVFLHDYVDEVRDAAEAFGFVPTFVWDGATAMAVGVLPL